MSNAEVSIIMPCYQSQQYVAEAVESVLNQTCRRFELIVIDDGSTDATQALIKDYAATDKRISLIQISNSGMAAARKKGLEVASADWIAFLDSDDVWLPIKLERQLEVAVAGDADVIVSSGYYFGEVERPWNVASFSIKGRQLLPSLVNKNTLPLASALVRRNVIRKAHSFSLSRYYDVVADYDMWLRLCDEDCRFVAMGDNHLFKYRIHAGQSTHSSRRLDTCKIVSELLQLHYNDGRISRPLFRSGIVHHFRELVDYELSQGNIQNVKSQLMVLDNYVNTKWAAHLIMFLANVNSSVAQKVSWRLLRTYI